MKELFSAEKPSLKLTKEECAIIRTFGGTRK